MSARFTAEQLAEFARRGMLAQTQANRVRVNVVRHPLSDPAQKTTPSIMAGLRIRESKDVSDLNKTEAAFLVKLRADKWAWVGVQAITLKLGDDCRYTPDFFTISEGHIVAWEVKGFWRDDARVKIKTAARAFPFIQFIAVTAKDRKFTGWNEEEIAP